MAYYGITYHQLLEMDYTEYNLLATCMVKNKARERLLRMEEISYPNMKDKDRRDLHKRIYKQAMPEEFFEKRAVRLEDINLF